MSAGVGALFLLSSHPRPRKTVKCTQWADGDMPVVKEGTHRFEGGICADLIVLSVKRVFSNGCVSACSCQHAPFLWGEKPEAFRIQLTSAPMALLLHKVYVYVHLGKLNSQ